MARVQDTATKQSLDDVMESPQIHKLFSTGAREKATFHLTMEVPNASRVDRLSVEAEACQVISKLWHTIWTQLARHIDDEYVVEQRPCQQVSSFQARFVEIVYNRMRVESRDAPKCTLHVEYNATIQEENPKVIQETGSLIFGTHHQVDFYRYTHTLDTRNKKKNGYFTAGLGVVCTCTTLYMSPYFVYGTPIV